MPAPSTLHNLLGHFFNQRFQSSAGNQHTMNPPHPLPQAVPVSLGKNLRDLAYGFGHGKNKLGRNFSYGVIQSLKECLYFLLCCWCIKEILD
ncbi:lens epithelial cell protein LEP503 [Tachysurus vachellii]|uniref:lens epithelial cell protein LEP503 n=1 Tax=Tachysurus vachellii TaxID=175792 RepID=UPI00296AE60E|nr:lens epithelial cell protein LEP503 [Tachysurus vachellii]